MTKWVPELLVRRDVQMPELVEWLGRSFRRLSLWTETVPEPTEGENLFIGGYDASTNLVVGGAYNGQALPAANTLNAGEYFLILVGGTLATPNAPEINGQVVAPNDRLISDGTVYVVMTATTSFLSKVTADTAAGKITFTVGADSAIDPAVSNDLTRKSYVDGGDNAVQGNLDAHIGYLYSDPEDPHGLSTHVSDTNIHYADAPNDGTSYARRDLAWVEVANFGVLYGTADPFILNTTPSVIDGYAERGTAGLFPIANVNRTNGTIVVPLAGVYKITALVVGTQGNDTKEESITLHLRVENSPGDNGDYPIGVFDVATDKTSTRAISAALTRSFALNAQLSLVMEATASLGTFSVALTTFEAALSV